jgi:hypothetical protein
MGLLGTRDQNKKESLNPAMSEKKVRAAKWRALREAQMKAKTLREKYFALHGSWSVRFAHLQKEGTEGVIRLLDEYEDFFDGRVEELERAERALRAAIDDVRLYEKRHPPQEVQREKQRKGRRHKAR